MIDLFVFQVFLCKKQRMRNELLAWLKPCGALGIVSCPQHLEVTNALKKLKNSQLENLDDAYDCNL